MDSVFKSMLAKRYLSPKTFGFLDPTVNLSWHLQINNKKQPKKSQQLISKNVLLKCCSFISQKISVVFHHRINLVSLSFWTFLQKHIQCISDYFSQEKYLLCIWDLKVSHWCLENVFLSICSSKICLGETKRERNETALFRSMTSNNLDL